MDKLKQIRINLILDAFYIDFFFNWFSTFLYAHTVYKDRIFRKFRIPWEHNRTLFFNNDINNIVLLYENRIYKIYVWIFII